MLGRFSEYIKNGEETQWLEFKAFGPPRGHDEISSKVVKEVLAMANSGYQGFILFGVNDDVRRRGREPIPGMDDTRSDDEVERQINTHLRNYCDPPISIRYSSHELKGKRIGVVAIPRSENRPHMVARNDKCDLRRGDYHVRRGTVIDVLTPHEIKDLPHPKEGKSVTVLNFSHKLFDDQLSQLEGMLEGDHIDFVWPNDKVNFDVERPFQPQVQKLLDSLGYRNHEWQEAGKFLVCVPGFSDAAAALLAELHGRMGQFPAVVRRKQVGGPSGTSYEIAEIMDLTQIRTEARKLTTGGLDGLA